MTAYNSNTNPRPINKSEATKQLTLLGYKLTENIFIRAFPPISNPNDGGRKADRLDWKQLENWQREGKGIYFVVNGGGHKDADVAFCRAIFYEHDDLDKATQLHLWGELHLPEPTFQVDTGGKSIHSYWVFEEPIAVEKWRQLQSDLLDFSDGDRAIKNPSRVMRLAGAWHSSGNQSLIVSASEKKYTFEELRAAIPAPQKIDTGVNVPTYTYADDIPLQQFLTRDDRDLIDSGVTSRRNDNGAKLARNLLGTAARLDYLGLKYTPSPRELFDDYCRRCTSDNGWNEREWESIWKSAQKSNPTASLTDDALKNCAKAWSYNQQKQQGNHPNYSNYANRQSAVKVVTHPSFFQSDIKDISKEIDDLIAKDLKGSELFINFVSLAQKYKITEYAISKIYHARTEELEREESTVKESEAKFRTLCKKLERIEAIEDIAFQDFEMERLSKEWKFRSKKALLDFHAKFLDSSHRKGEKLTYGLTEYFNKFADSSTDWLIRGWIPNKVVTVLHAAGGVGKTRLVSSICRALIAGKSWSGYDVEAPCCVLFIETDQGSVVNINMFDEQGYLDEPEEVRERFLINDNWNINQFGKLKSMLGYLQDSHPNSKILVVIDSLTTVSSKATFSENDQEFARPLVRLRAIAEDFNCSFLVLHHSNRSGECRGTTAIFNAADQVLKLERSDPKNPTSPLFLDIQKTRSREPARYSLKYDADTWTWEIVGRVEADGNLQDSYGAVSRAILDHAKQNPGVGFESEEFAHVLNLAPATCRKELGFLVREGCISSIRRGRKRKVYFVGRLTRSIDPTDPTDPRKNEVEFSEKKQKNSDQLDQLTEPAQGIAPELIQTSDQFGSVGSVQQSQPPESSLSRNDAIEEAMTVDVPVAIVEPKIGDEIVNEAGVAIAKVEKVSSYFILLRSLIDKDLCGKLNKDGLWVASSKQFRHWKELLQLQLKREAIAPEVDKALCPGCESFDAANRKCDHFNIVWKKSEQLIKEGECDHFQENAIAPPDEPDWQPGDKLLMSVFGSAKKYEVEFVRFTWLEDGTYKAIVLLEGKEVEWNVDMLSRPGGQL